MSPKPNPTSNPAFQFPPRLSDEGELFRYYGDISEEQRKLLKPFIFEGDDNAAKAQIDITQVGETPDSTMEEILGNDISDLLVKNCQGAVFPTTVNKYLKLVCHYVNETYGDEPPYCATTEYLLWSGLLTENWKGAISYLEMAVVTRERFSKTKYIFIQITDGEVRHATLLVISPLYKTIEFLDSEQTRDRSKKLRNEVLLKAMILLSKFLNRKFIPLEWRLRFGSPAQ